MVKKNVASVEEHAAPQKGEASESISAGPSTSSSPQHGPSSLQAQVFADVVALMATSAPHKHLFLTDLEWLVMPPLMLGQCSLIRREGRPFAFVSWAFLGPEAAARMTPPQLRLRPSDWRSGDEAWIIDVVAPFGGGDDTLYIDSMDTVWGGDGVDTVVASLRPMVLTLSQGPQVSQKDGGGRDGNALLLLHRQPEWRRCFRTGFSNRSEIIFINRLMRVPVAVGVAE